MSACRVDPYGLARTAAVALLVFPLLAVPSFYLGQGVADALDDNPSNGVLALGLILGVTVPGALSIVFARFWGEVRWLAALGLGLGSGIAAVGVLLATFVAVCTATTCIV